MEHANLDGMTGTAAAPKPSAGKEGQLVYIGGTAGPAQLSLLSGETTEGVARLQVGDLCVVAVRRAGTPLTMLICTVGAHWWLLARDSLVLRVGPRKFSFAFPGYFLGLALPEGCFDRDVRKLETVLASFCTYVDHAGERDSDFCIRKPETNFWTSAYAKIRALSFPRSPTGRHPETTQWTWRQATLNFHRASRTSAATKVVARILTGNFDPSKHIEVLGPVTAVAAAFRQGAPYIFPSLRAVSDIVDAVEASMGIGTGNWAVAPDRWVPIPDGVMYWHWKLSGVMQLLRVVADLGERDKANGRMPFGTGLLAELVGGEVSGCQQGHQFGRRAEPEETTRPWKTT